MSSYHYYLLDSSFWIEWWQFAGNPKTAPNQIKTIIEALHAPTAAPIINGIILAEILRGLSQSQTDQYRTKELMNIECINITSHTYVQAAKLGQRLDKKGQKIALPDCIIAATAIENNATLVTKDKHFTRFPNLDIFLL